jgi:hypothetical protein
MPSDREPVRILTLITTVTHSWTGIRGQKITCRSSAELC